MFISYKKAIKWIADNDEPTILDAEEIQYQISVCLVADLFKKDRIEVAKKIVQCRYEDF